jgi:hypothetical protein
VVLKHRLAALGPRGPVIVYELEPLTEKLERVDPWASGNISTWLVPRREIQPFAGSRQWGRRSSSGARARCDHHSPQPANTGTNAALSWPALRALGGWENLVRRGKSYPLCRGQSERWLQAIIAKDLSRVDVTLQPNHLYEQVCAQAAGQHGILDLLAVMRASRLAILESKASENVDLPLRAADYWSRIRHHHGAGDFARYGYFPGITLQPVPPLVFLISPALRFHPSRDTLLRFLSPEMEVIRVGLAESWRRGIRVMMRQ